MSRHTVVDRSCIAFSMKIFLETAPVKAANFPRPQRIANAGGVSPDVRFVGQGDKVARTCISTVMLVPFPRNLGCGRNPSPPSCSSNRGGQNQGATRRKLHRPGIASTDVTMHVTTTRSSADLAKPKPTLTRYTLAKDTIILQIGRPQAASSQRTRVVRTQG